MNGFVGEYEPPNGAHHPHEPQDRPKLAKPRAAKRRVQPPLPHVAFLKRETSEPLPAHTVAISASIIALPRPKRKTVPALVLLSKPAVPLRVVPVPM